MSFAADVKQLSQPVGQISFPPQLLVKKGRVARDLGVSVRLVEKWTQLGVIPALRIGRRMTLYDMSRVLEALRAYETKTLNRKK